MNKKKQYFVSTYLLILCVTHTPDYRQDVQNAHRNTDPRSDLPEERFRSGGAAVLLSDAAQRQLHANSGTYLSINTNITNNSYRISLASPIYDRGGPICPRSVKKRVRMTRPNLTGGKNRFRLPAA